MKDNYMLILIVKRASFYIFEIEKVRMLFN